MRYIKNRFQKYLPDKNALAQNKVLKIFGALLHNPNLWHFNRYSVASAFSVGLFFAWIPIPFQMALAAGIAIVVHANLPISMALVWLTNPVTMPPLFYFAYRLGAWILSYPLKPFKFALSLDWLMGQLQSTWKPFLFGCIFLAIISAIIGNIAIRILWRQAVIRSWSSRSWRKSPSPKARERVNKKR